MARIKGVSGREYEVWEPGKEPPTTDDLKTKLQELERENRRLQEALSHLACVVAEYGLCRPETQLARMELGEASVRYVEDRNWDSKNLGVIARNLVAEMREKGELP